MISPAVQSFPIRYETPVIAAVIVEPSACIIARHIRARARPVFVVERNALFTASSAPSCNTFPSDKTVVH